MIRSFLFACFLSCAALTVSRADEFALKDGDTIAFLGDSITGARAYSRIIENYTLLRFPERKIRFTNVGQGGETAKGSLQRLDEAVFARGATVLTVAYGINDIGWGTKADDAHKADFLGSIEEIIKRCREHNVRVFICSAAITAEAPETAEKGYLQTMCDEGLARAKALGAGVIDVQRGMRAIQHRVIASNSKEKDKSKHTSMHAPDGVHLNDLGQMAMAVTILKGLGAPADVSWPTLSAKTGNVTNSESCDISQFKAQPEGYSCVRHDLRQPLNLHSLWMLSGFFIPISEELNRYGLTVTDLPPGKYEMRAGGRRVGTWSDEQLAKGVNLASASGEQWEPGGPWQAQGQVLKTITDVRDELEWAARDLKKFLSHHATQPELSKKAAEIEASLIAFQRDLAKPLPTTIELRKAPPEKK